MRKFAPALLALALVACGQSEAPSAPQEAPTTGVGAITLSSTEDLPDWLLVAHQSGGGEIHFNQRAITRDGEGHADIWTQVRYGSQQIYSGTDGTTETIVRYNTERIHYRFKCAEEQFTIVERQIMGANETVVARDEPEELYRATPQAGVARLVLPIACRGS